jgi:hypothetical protein
MGWRHLWRNWFPSNERVWFAVLLAGVVVTAVVVPPLVAPQLGQTTPDSAAGTSEPPTTTLASPSPTSPAATASPTGKPTTPASTGATGAVDRPPGEFRPIVIEAEAPGNIFPGGASVIECVPCHGGYRVRYIFGPDRLTLKADVPTGGTRTVTVVYESDGPRVIKIDVNGVFVLEKAVTGTGWEVPQTMTFTTGIPAGVVSISTYNDESPAPDIDAITIS